MSWFRYCAIAVVSLSLTGCGFTPIAATRDHAGERTAISELDLLGISDRFAYDVRKEFFAFIDRNPTSQLSLRTTVALRTEAFAIEEDDTVTRIALTYEATYEFLLEGEVVDSGVLRSSTGFNATTSQFASAVSRRDAEAKLARDLGKKLLAVVRARRNRLTEFAGG